MHLRNPLSSRVCRGVALIGLASGLCFGQAGVVLLQDDFNRADSDTLGPPWAELNQNDVQRIQFEYVAMPSVIEVESGTFAFHYSAEEIADIFGCFDDPPGLCRNFGHPAAFAPLSQPATAFPISLSFDFTPHPDERIQHRVGLMPVEPFASTGDGIFPVIPNQGLEVLIQHTSNVFDNSAVQTVLHDGSVLGGATIAHEAWPFQFVSGTTYSVEVVITADYSMTVTVGDGSQSHTLLSPTVPVTFPFERVYVIDAQGGVSFDGPGPAEYFTRFDNIRVAQTPIDVSIDIKPGSDPNSINLSSAAVVPVAILSTPNFDATTVQGESIALAGASVKMVGKSGKLLVHEEDVDADGLMDLVAQVVTEQFLIVPGDSVAVLEAVTASGLPIRGRDTIRIVPD